MDSVFGLGQVVSRMRAEGHDLAWLTDQVAIRPHDEKRTFGEVLPRSAIRSWAEQLMDIDVDLFGPKIERVRPPLKPAEQVAAYAGPVHVVAGELQAGSLVLPSELDEMRAVAPQLTTSVMPGAGHFIHAQMPDRFAAELVAFLRANDL